MDERASARRGPSKQERTRAGTETDVRLRGAQPSAPELADALNASNPKIALSADTTELVGAASARSLPLHPPDPREPQTLARLLQRTPSGGYEIADVDLVRAIRAWNERGERQVTQRLCELLVDRCMPEFQRRSSGLRQRPDLMQEAIQGMIEQLLREALNPREVFMTLNFIHYLRCLCADNFGRVLRQEGLSYKRDAQGRPLGRPQHIPRALVEQIDVSAEDRDDPSAQSRTIADPHDTMGDRMAALEAQRILAYLPDPLDRRIMALRALEHLPWNDIAALCGKTERTMRLRYEKARVTLRECIKAEMAQAAALGEE